VIGARATADDQTESRGSYAGHVTQPDRVEDADLRMTIDQLEKDNRDLQGLRQQAEQALALTRRQVSKLLEESVPLRSAAEVNASSIARLEGELVSVKEALDQARHKLSAAESALRQRQEENAQVWAELSPAKSRITELERRLKDHEEEKSALERELAEANAWAFKLAGLRREAEEKKLSIERALELECRRRDVAEQESGALRNLAAALQQQVVTSDADRREIQERRDEAYDELAAVTRFLRASESSAAVHEAKYVWAARVLDVMLRSRRWWSPLLPAAWSRKRYLARLADEQLFDSESYLRRYPDVRASGQDQLRHYIAHGMAEGRQP